MRWTGRSARQCGRPARTLGKILNHFRFMAVPCKPCMDAIPRCGLLRRSIIATLQGNEKKTGNALDGWTSSLRSSKMAFIQSRTTAVSSDAGHAGRSKPGIFARLLDAIATSRQRQADREVARFIEMNGGKLTDDLEFRIEQRVLHGREPSRRL